MRDVARITRSPRFSCVVDGVRATVRCSVDTWTVGSVPSVRASV
jgi:hypothetical protein